MINPLTLLTRIRRGQVELYEVEQTELTQEQVEYAKTITKLGDKVDYPFVTSEGDTVYKLVEVIQVDYLRNRATLQYLSKRRWLWIDVPIFDELPMF